MAGVPHPDISTLCIFQICLPVDLVWPWPKCPWCTCSLMLSPLRSLPKRQQSNTKIAFWQFSSWLWWQESREILGLRHELRLMGLCCPSDAALPTRAWKLPGGEKHRGLQWEPSQWMHPPKTVITSSTQNKKQGSPLSSFPWILQVFCYTASSTVRNGWKDRQAFWKFPFFGNWSNISCICQLV